MIKGINKSSLKQWIEQSLRDNTNILAAGYQGKTLLYEDAEHRYVIKVPHGAGLVKYIHTLMLRREDRVYAKLKDFPGCPKCYGLVNNSYLVLTHIKGHPIRKEQPANHEAYFEKLFSLIEDMHKHQVAHMDLKKKDNLLVTDKDMPCLIDFGTAVIKKPGFHPLNTFWFNLAKRFDYNAWVKHKYHNNFHNLSTEDAVYYQRTLVEKLSSTIKELYRRIKT